ncbi:hypothetical protein BBD41_09240 [Paenibacillus ihbetae]|uniref:Gram-positive cocci surface proteins LPxTG domain-containing protein n=2 Tax=Paenibacillus ihbetae TaxID=1870820 RepID=A0A1B2DYJ5_9BACL|nr:hypothetical protein BBD41_09240 [Paenibacillus ihbetae]
MLPVKRKLGFVLLMIFSLFMIHPAEAAVDPVEDIREMVTPEFMTYTSGSLRPVKDDYGITDTEDVQLGEGHPYYIVSSEFLKSSSADGEHTSDDIFEHGGYLFVMEENGKPVGNVDVTKENGAWSVFKLSSGTGPVEAIIDARQQSAAAPDTKLIYDQALGLLGISQNEKYVQTAGEPKLSSAQEIDIQSLGNQLIQHYQESRKLPPGSAGGRLFPSDSTNVHGKYYTVGAVIFAGFAIIGAAIMLLRKRRSKL